MSSLLFIAPADLGETVLATAALEHARAEMPEARITVVCGPEAAILFRTLPNLAAIHVWRREEGYGAWVRFAWRFAREPFDLVVDLGASTAGYAIRAKRRVAQRAARVLRHRIEEYTELLSAETPLSPAVVLDKAARAAAKAAAPDAGPLLVLAPGGASAPLLWPAERFAAVARRLASGAGPLAQARIALLGGEEDADLTRAIAASLQADDVRALDLAGKLDLLGAAALLERATLYLGNDSALTQIAAAMGAPTLGLYGPTDERVRGPHGRRALTLRGRAYEEIMAAPALDERSQMEDLSVDAVEAAALDLLRAGGLR